MLEVLIATMHQTDMSLFNRMNIQSDVVIANQTDKNEVVRTEIDGHNVVMVNSDTLGVGINRNLALIYSSADIFLFADDDVVYNNGYAKEVEKAFMKQSAADVIIFGMNLIKNGQVIERISNENKRLHLWNSMQYGTYVLAIKRTAMRKANLKFSHLFGGGCIYGSGEDSLFIRDCFRNGLKVYSSSYCLGKCFKDTSSWFTGYNEKYFYDKGALLACAFPKLKYLLSLYYSFRFRTLCDFSVWKIFKLYCNGIKGFRLLKPYKMA